MELRPYQAKAVQGVRDAWESGAKNVLLQLSTGGGKTCIFSKVIADNPEPSIAIAHRVELVSQISLTLARYGVRHNVIAQKSTIREIVSIHMLEIGRSYFDPQAKCVVAGVDTLIRLPADTPWFSRIKLVVQDEGHHPLKKNKWGAAADLFPNAVGLYPTATPVRADGKGLGRHADGLMDALIVGPPMRQLITDGFLTDYRVIAPPNDLDLSRVPLSAGGDYSPPKLRTAVHKSKITGDVVKHYLRFAAGKLGVTFAVSIEAATEIAEEFRAQGVPAEVITGKTPALLRSQIMGRFRRREILQIVNVDIMGEGVDVPAIEVVSMARPTQSYGLYSQNLGRGLRPMPGKTHAIIIDHVGNCVRHGFPDDVRRVWSLDRREKRSRGTPDDVIPLKNCLNPMCMAVYPRTKKACPHCGFYTEPTSRSSPEFVDGDLTELSPEVLAMMRGEIRRIDNVPRIPGNLDHVAQRAVANRHIERQQAQAGLRTAIAQYAGVHKHRGCDDSEIYRLFYFTFGIDVGGAQTLGAVDAQLLLKKIVDNIVNSV